ncbi:MAG: OmpH family outer membrane protein [Pseudomonadota bacterium]|nr:OmpH family outer membrane protein [Pseudomonadota bacterium]
MSLYARRFFAISIFFLALGFSGVASAELKIGYVDLQRVVLESGQAQALKQTLEGEAAELRGALAADQQQLKSAREAFERDSLAMSTEQRQEKERELIAMQRELQRKEIQSQQQLQSKSAEEQKRLLNDISEIVDKLAAKGKYDIILAEGVLFASDRLDITDQVVAELAKGKK